MTRTNLLNGSAPSREKAHICLEAATVILSCRVKSFSQHGVSDITLACGLAHPHEELYNKEESHQADCAAFADGVVVDLGHGLAEGSGEEGFQIG